MTPKRLPGRLTPAQFNALRWYAGEPAPYARKPRQSATDALIRAGLIDTEGHAVPRDRWPLEWHRDPTSRVSYGRYWVVVGEDVAHPSIEIGRWELEFNRDHPSGWCLFGPNGSPFGQLMGDIRDTAMAEAERFIRQGW